MDQYIVELGECAILFYDLCELIKIIKENGSEDLNEYIDFLIEKRDEACRPKESF